MTAATPQSIDIFLSHSSRDAELAKALAELFRSAFSLSAKQIRCTSVSGYKLDAGADTNQQLRRETVEARLLVGLITEVSAESAYVLFELGARWGSEKPLVPLLGAGAGANVLAGPLSGLNALWCCREDLLQLIANCATHLGSTAESPEVYSGHIDRVVAVSQELAVQRGLEAPDDVPSVGDTVSLDDFACDYLMVFSRPRNEGQIYAGIDGYKGREAARYQEAIEASQRLGLVKYTGDAYRLTSHGWKLTDQLWQRKILDCIGESHSLKDQEIAELVVLTDGELEKNELRRHLDALESRGLVTLNKTRGWWSVRLTFDGVTYRKHRPPFELD